MSDTRDAPPGGIAPRETPARDIPVPDTPARDRPLGLSLLTWLLWFWAGAALLVVLGLAVGERPVAMSGRTVPRPEALTALLPILLPMALAAAGAALALGLHRQWARPAMLLPFGLAAVAPAFTGAATTPLDLLGSAAAILPFAALVAWYLYGSARVRAYFAALRTTPRGGAGVPGG